MEPPLPLTRKRSKNIPNDHYDDQQKPSKKMKRLEDEIKMPSFIFDPEAGKVFDMF